MEDWQFGDISLAEPFNSDFPGQDISESSPQQLGATCPDCNAVMQPSFGQLLVKCLSCGCIFCARCTALYLPQPTSPPAHSGADSTAQTLALPPVSNSQQQETVAAAAAAFRGLLATCSCEAVDRKAVEQCWGPATVAYWPTGDLQHQLLLLLLLQRHQRQVIPLLSRGLLQRLQDNWREAESAVLTWQHVQAAAQVVTEQQQHGILRHTNQLDPQQQQTEQQEDASDHSLQVIPTAATPTFQADDGRQSTPAHMPMDMESCNGSASTLQQHAQAHASSSAAVAAAAATRAVSEPPNHNLQQQQQLEVDDMQIDDLEVTPVRLVRVPANLHQQVEVAARGAESILAAPAPAADAAALSQAAEGVELLNLAHQVTAAGSPEMLEEEKLFMDGHKQHWTTAAAATAAAVVAVDHEHWLPGAVRVHSVNGHSAPSPGSQPQGNGLSEATDADGQLGIEDFEQPQQLSGLPEQPSVTKDILSLQAQQQPVVRPVQTPAVLDGKGGKLRLVESEAAANSSGQVVQAGVPQLSEFGLHEAPPPVLPDDPVVLIDGEHHGASTWWQRS